METFGRDIAISALSDNLSLVTACDSCGGIGDKELDEVSVPAELVGRLTTRVALLEILSVGAEPKTVAVAISAEPDPTGIKILNGVRKELSDAGLSEIPLIISTEKNTPTRQTGLGVTVSGIGENTKLTLGLSRPGDTVYCLGSPMVGPEVAAASASSLVCAEDVRSLLKVPGIHDIIPAGSGGLAAELTLLKESLSLDFRPYEPQPVDLGKSAGPSTCVLFTCSEEQSNLSVNGKVATKIGAFSGTPLTTK